MEPIIVHIDKQLDELLVGEFYEFIEAKRTEDERLSYALLYELGSEIVENHSYPTFEILYKSLSNCSLTGYNFESCEEECPRFLECLRELLGELLPKIKLVGVSSEIQDPQLRKYWDDFVNDHLSKVGDLHEILVFHRIGSMCKELPLDIFKSLPVVYFHQVHNT